VNHKDKKVRQGGINELLEDDDMTLRSSFRSQKSIYNKVTNRYLVDTDRNPNQAVIRTNNWLLYDEKPKLAELPTP
jgi:hypothetical protein